MKICGRCKKEQSLEEFSKSKNRKDGLHPTCKSCNKDYRELNKEVLKQKKKSYYSRSDIRAREKISHAERYSNNRESHIQSIRDYYEENRESFLLKKSRERARKSGLDHSIALEDIIIPEYCPILGVKLTGSFGQGQLQTNSSLDRIDSTKGYIKGNVQVISRKANTMKNNATVEELKQFAKWCEKL